MLATVEDALSATIRAFALCICASEIFCRQSAQMARPEQHCRRYSLNSPMCKCLQACHGRKVVRHLIHTQVRFEVMMAQHQFRQSCGGIRQRKSAPQGSASGGQRFW